MRKRLGCRSCQLYSRSLLRCVNGKINPPTLKGAVSAAIIMGPSYICDRDGMNGRVYAELRKMHNADQSKRKEN